MPCRVFSLGLYVCMLGVSGRTDTDDGEGYVGGVGGITLHRYSTGVRLGTGLAWAWAPGEAY